MRRGHRALPRGGSIDGWKHLVGRQIQARIQVVVCRVNDRQDPGDVVAIGEGGNGARENGRAGEQAILLGPTAHALACSGGDYNDSDASLSSHVHAVTATITADKRPFDQLRCKRI